MQASAVGYPVANEKRAMRQQYAQRTLKQFTSSGYFYPSSSYSNLHLNPNISVSSEPYSDTSDGFLSLGDSGSTGTLQLRCRMAVASRHYIATSFISPN